MRARAGSGLPGAHLIARSPSPRHRDVTLPSCVSRRPFDPDAGLVRWGRSSLVVVRGRFDMRGCLISS
jgi:hypothetical protein